MLAQREEIAFVQLVCSACQVQTLALVTGVPPWSEEDEAGGQAETATRPAGAAGREPDAITASDVVDMHDFLATYEGDLHDLLDNGRGGRRR